MKLPNGRIPLVLAVIGILLLALLPSVRAERDSLSDEVTRGIASGLMDSTPPHPTFTPAEMSLALMLAKQQAKRQSELFAQREAQARAAAAAAAAAKAKALAALEEKYIRAGMALGLTRSQATIARRIIVVGEKMGITWYGQVIAIATALQESQLKNYTYAVDHDSLGVFQQRPSTGWGTPAQITNVEYASRAFYNALKRLPYNNMAVTTAAQAVQGSAYPYAYADDEWLARRIVTAVNSH